MSRTEKRQHHALARERLAAHGDDDLAALGELDRVGEQVEQDLAQPGQVGADRRRHVALEDVGDVETLLGRARADQVERRLDALAQVERMRLDVHPPGLDLREVEDVVDDRQQRVAGVADGRGEVALLVVERRVEEQSAHADHGVHRRPDLVTHRRQERALGLVRGLGGGACLLGLLEQARVLDRDHGLVGKGLEQLLLLVRERPWRLAQDDDRTDALALPQHRRHDHGVVADQIDDAAHRGRRVAHRRCIVDLHDTPLTDHARRQGVVQRLRKGVHERIERRAAPGHGVHQAIVFAQEDAELFAREQVPAALEDLVEHRRRVGNRAADHRQHLGGGGLLFQRFPGLVEQARVLDRDHGLVGEGLATGRCSLSAKQAWRSATTAIDPIATAPRTIGTTA